MKGRQKKSPIVLWNNGGLKFYLQSIADVGEKSQMSGALDRNGQQPLMTGAGAGHSAGNDLSSLRKISPQAGNIFVIDGLNLIDAESANLSSGLSVAGSVVTLHVGKTSLLR